jgi:hypothetical protein
MTDSPDWQTTLTGPGGSDIAGGVTVLAQYIVTTVVSAAAYNLATQPLPAGSFIIVAKTQVSYGGASIFNTTFWLSSLPAASGPVTADLWDYTEVTVGNGGGGSINQSVALMSYQVLTVPTTAYFCWQGSSVGGIGPYSTWLICAQVA